MNDSFLRQNIHLDFGEVHVFLICLKNFTMKISYLHKCLERLGWFRIENGWLAILAVKSIRLGRRTNKTNLVCRVGAISVETSCPVVTTHRTCTVN